MSGLLTRMEKKIAELEKEDEAKTDKSPIASNKGDEPLN